MNPLFAGFSASISEFKKNPSELLNKADGEPVAILVHNKPVAYMVPAEMYEHIMNLLEDAELAAIAHERLKEEGDALEVSLDDL